MESHFSAEKTAPQSVQDGTITPPHPADRVTLELPEITVTLLERLLGSGQLRLQAGMGDYLLEFSPDNGAAARTDNHQLQLGYPAVIETTPEPRHHRIQRPRDELHLVEDGNKLESIRITNISESGLGLICSKPVFTLTPGKSVLTLRLEFPHGRWAPCKARVVRIRRRPRQAVLGLQFINPPPRTLRLLRAYIFHHTSRALGNHRE